MDLRRVRQDPRGFRGDVLDDLDARRDGRMEKFQGLFDDRLELERPFLLARGPAEGEDLPDELAGAVPGLMTSSRWPLI